MKDSFCTVLIRNKTVEGHNVVPTIMNFSQLICCSRNQLPGFYIMNTLAVTKSIFWDFQKQPSEVFYKERCSRKFCKINRKTPAPDSVF